MHPHYLIDGYNVIHKIPELRSAMKTSLEKARNALIRRILTYLATKKIEITLIFDGDDVGFVGNPYERKRRLHIYYSHAPEKADPLIKRFIRQKADSAQLFLVTEDNDLINFGKSRGVKNISPAQFYQLLRKEAQQTQLDQKFDKPMTEEDLATWLKIFGEGED
ncbi:MAG: NYN domain-containing protein [Calditrichaeota bacterium]|nr:NYN domain-containing protein [Calditrichota bacterium]